MKDHPKKPVKAVAATGTAGIVYGILNQAGVTNPWLAIISLASIFGLTYLAPNPKVDK